MANNKSLAAANKAKNDEFYTQLSDIENELRHYKQHFKGKTVFCNCDDPYESNFFKYFAINFNHLGLKKLICTCYASSPVVYTQLSFFGEDKVVGKEQSDRKPYKIEITEVKDLNNDGAVDLTDIELLLKSVDGQPTLLQGDGDFRSEECIELMKQADIVVTNPPFSLFREYVAQLVTYDKKFIILGNKNAITYKEVFPLFKENKLWIGYMPMSAEIYFDVPQTFIDEALKLNKDRSVVTHNGRYMARSQSIWFTNLDIQKRHEKLILYKTYTPKEYPQYDNYKAIEVSKTADIPCDYDGIMGVPITFMDKYNPDQFEIIGTDSLYYSEEIGILPIGKEWCDIYRSQGGTGHMSPSMRNLVLLVDGKAKTVYKRILIRRKG